MDSLTDKLDQLKLRSGRRAAPPPRSTVTPAPRSLAETIGGAEQHTAHGASWYIARSFEDVCADHGLSATECAQSRVVAGTGPTGVNWPLQSADALVIDIETGGLPGSPVFLIGVVALDEWPLTVHQWLARDYPEECAILAALADWIGPRRTWVSFNGRSFDEPFIRDRAVIHRCAIPPAERHWDLLHAARRRWRQELPNCRLATLEAQILKRPRIGDVPSADVPDLFHHFMRTGNAGPVSGVVLHNQIDLVSSTQLIYFLSEPSA